MPRRYDRRSYVTASQSKRFKPHRPELAHDHTGAFGSFRSPAVVGVSDYVRVANRDMARRARKAERQWLRSL